MSEHALPDPKDVAKHDAEVIALNASNTRVFTDEFIDEEGKTVVRESYELWPMLDIRMSQQDIDSLATKWMPSNIFHGTDNIDRPIAALRWMMQQTHITVDASEELRNLRLFHELKAFEAEGQDKSKNKAYQGVTQPTPYEINKVGHADTSEQDIKNAVAHLETASSEGLSNLLDTLLDIEDRVAPRTTNTNLVRLFNAIDTKTDGKDRDLIIAKRILLILLDQKLNPEDYSD